MDLEVPHDEAFSRREWVVERVGWTLVTLFVLAGLVGLLGSGPLSWATTQDDAAVVVTYDTVTHYEADESITLTLHPAAVADDTVAVELSGPWVGGVDIQGIWPEPSAQRLVPGGVVLEFDVAEPGTLEATITYRAQEYGTLDAELAAGSDVVTFSQLVIP